LSSANQLVGPLKVQQLANTVLATEGRGRGSNSHKNLFKRALSKLWVVVIHYVVDQKADEEVDATFIKEIARIDLGGHHLDFRRVGA
jgi:ATP sulfurylase